MAQVNGFTSLIRMSDADGLTVGVCVLLRVGCNVNQGTRYAK